jgi:hypothetical protein
MQKTYCDKCGAECVNYIARMYGSVQHTTSGGEQVAEDDIRALELCRGCFEPLAAEYKIRVRTVEADGPLVAEVRSYP